MAETETLEARVEQLERIVLKLSEMMADVHTHHSFKMGDALKPVLERHKEKPPA